MCQKSFFMEERFFARLFSFDHLLAANSYGVSAARPLYGKASIITWRRALTLGAMARESFAGGLNKLC